MQELQVVIEKKPGSVSFNFEEAKAFLNERLEEYRAAVFTDDSIKEAKGYVAYLRKEQTAFKSRVTEVKNEYMQPFNDFKEKADELVRLYDEPINFINDQVADFEERRKAQKKKAILAIYNELIGDVADYLPLNRIYNIKWENATFKEKDIRIEISEVAESTRQAIETIKAMESESVEKALLIYRTDLSLTNAIAYINNYEKQKAEILVREQEKRRFEEAERIRREEREKIEAEQRAKVEMEKAVEEAKAQAAQEVVESLIPQEVDENEQNYTCIIKVGKSGKEALEMYMDSVGIEWQIF